MSHLRAGERPANWQYADSRPARCWTGGFETTRQRIMSYCEIIIFTGDRPTGGIEFRNAWGGAARIWNSLFNKYIKDQNIPYHSWINEKEQRKLWDLAHNKKLQMFERIVHFSTFDRAYISRNHFKQFAADLRSFNLALTAKVQL